MPEPRTTRVDDTIITVLEDADPAPRVAKLIWLESHQAWCSPDVYADLTGSKRGFDSEQQYHAFMEDKIRQTYKFTHFPGFNQWFT